MNVSQLRKSEPETFEFTTETRDGLIALGAGLLACGYQFVTVTPETQRIVNARMGTSGGFDLRDIFGWSRSFRPVNIPGPMRDLFDRADVITSHGSTCSSRVRFSTLGGNILMHSAFPTSSPDCVFFGPDTYRFVRFVLCHLPARDAMTRVIDIGCGSGAGGLAVAAALPASSLVLADINAKALAFARVNAGLAGIDAVEFVLSDVLDGVTGQFDVIIANPPYMKDALKRTYRDGGAHYGTDLSVRIVRESLTRLSPGGRLLLYTGAPVVDGVDQFLTAVGKCLHDVACTVTYTEIDPDVFGEELRGSAYARVERIAAVGLVVEMA